MDLKHLPVLVTDLTHSHIEHLKEFFANRFHGGDTLGQILGLEKPEPPAKFSVHPPPKPGLPNAIKEIKK